jgi:hypothetical protein
MTSSHTVSTTLVLWLIAPQQSIEPLVAKFCYSREDPNAIRIWFHVGRGEPVEWCFARDLLARGVEGRTGLGDVTIWPSAGPVADAAGKVLNIELSSPAGRAHFGATVKEISDFLRLTYQVVPSGEESEHFDTEAELNDLLRQASLTRNAATPQASNIAKSVLRPSARSGCVKIASAMAV